MSLEEQVNTGIKSAMKAKNEPELRGLRAIKSAILLQKTEGGKKTEITEEDETKLMKKQVKQRKESLEMYREQNRPELAAREEEEIEVIQKFLPEQMGEEQVREKVQEIISQTGATSPSDMGKVMGMAMKQLSGKADRKSTRLNSSH